MTSIESPNFDHSLDSENWSIIPLPALKDNYMYLVVDHCEKQCAVVDPVNPQKCLDAIAKLPNGPYNLSCVLTTHSHWDHAGGNIQLKTMLKKSKTFSPLPVFYGGKGDNAAGTDVECKQDDVINIGKIQAKVHYTPFHTSGHVCYELHHSNDKVSKSPTAAVFTGDCLFVSGCGNLNDGKPAQLYNAFHQLGSKLHPATLVYCGHEYTLSNLQYALAAESDNAYTIAKMKWATEQRSLGKYTIPSTIEEEHKCNPFMRAAFGTGNEKTLKALLKENKCTTPIEAIHFIRAHKSSGSWKK